jgi:anti-anti-sigma regulatory factor
MTRNPRTVKRGASRKPAAGRKPEVMHYTLVIDRQCTVREAEAFKLALHAAEDSSGDFTVEAGAVERIDTAGLQLLLGFAARLRTMQRRLVWCTVSPALRQGAQRLGVAAALGLPEQPA